MLYTTTPNGNDRYDLVRMKYVHRREFVTRDMAADAGDPKMEGSLYSDEQWESECVGQVYEDPRAARDAALGAAVRKALHGSSGVHCALLGDGMQDETLKQFVFCAIADALKEEETE
jgi:hypothetical protein